MTTARLLILLTGSVCAEAGVPIQAPGQEPSVLQLMANARTSLERGDVNGARASLERVLSRDAGNKQARLALVDVLIRMAQWTEAESQARVLSNQFPQDTEPVYLLAQIALRQGDPASANEFASRCLSRGDDRSEIHKVVALSDYLLGRTEQFETHIQAVLEKNPRDAEARYLLARYFYETKQFRQSLNAFQDVLDLQPEHYKAHYYAGLVYQMTNDTDRARAEFLAAIRIVERKQIRYAWPFADLGRQLADAGDLDAAIEWLSQGIRHDPACPKVYYEYARALFHKGPLPEVEKALFEAVRLDPGYTEAYYLLARYYRKADRNLVADQVLAKFRDLKAHPVPSPFGLPRQ
jgi:tetratricopeptide (TPR) repeat protein